MEKSDTEPQHENLIPVAFSLPPHMKRLIRKYALRDTDGNKSKWMQSKLEIIFSEEEKKSGKRKNKE